MFNGKIAYRWKIKVTKYHEILEQTIPYIHVYEQFGLPENCQEIPLPKWWIFNWDMPEPTNYKQTQA